MPLPSICFAAVVSLLMLCGCAGPEGSAPPFVHGALRVSPDGRYLMHEDGTPFLYLGDTAWQLFHRLDSAETVSYFEDRRKKGFNVIQACILAELDGLETPNRRGDCPLAGNDPTAPNEAYFAWVDTVIRMAARHGLYVGLLPTWGDKVNRKWGVGPECFDSENAFAYGRFLGRRYKDFPNIIWINGGDRPGHEKTEVWDALAAGIKREDSLHLMTFHPSGEASSGMCFHDRGWLDFNMFQSGHAQTDYAIYERLLLPDYRRSPAKPVLDGEPRYEDIPIRFKAENGRFTDADVRQTLYWSLFSGACGYTYGANDVWQFHTPGRKPMCDARSHWRDALQLPGSSQIIHARRLTERVDWPNRIAAPGMILDRQTDQADRALAVRGAGYAYVYFPNGNPLSVSLSEIPDARKLKLAWYDPRCGTQRAIGRFEAVGTYRAVPPSSGKGNDWILIMKSC
ncbi:glycoside hydrolase family 140 protein [Alistipes timonensis]